MKFLIIIMMCGTPVQFTGYDGYNWVEWPDKNNPGALTEIETLMQIPGEDKTSMPIKEIEISKMSGKICF